jgi:hypothetical protein
VQSMQSMRSVRSVRSVRPLRMIQALAPQLAPFVLASPGPGQGLEMQNARHQQQQQLGMHADVGGRIGMQLTEPEQSRLGLGRTWRVCERAMQSAEPEGLLAGPRGCWSVLPLSRNQVSERG